MKYSTMAIAAVLYCGFAIAGDDATCDNACKEAKGWPVPLERQNPQYPAAAQEKGIEGCVVVSFVITPQGLADQYQILDSQPKGVFDAVTLRALNGWKFKIPPKPGRYAQRIEYRLGDMVDKACDRCEPKPRKPLRCMEQPTYDQLNAPKAK